MKPLFLNFSTTAFVILMTMGALDFLEKQNYIVAGVFLLLGLWLPAQRDLDTLFRRRFGIATENKADSENGKGVGSPE